MTWQPSRKGTPDGITAPPPLLAATRDPGEVAALLSTDREAGLSSEEAERRLEAEGPNRLPEPPRETIVQIFLRQLQEPMAVLLMVAAAVSGLALGERVDAVAILAIVALNAGIGAVQEGRASRALEALRSLETPLARVVRDGRVLELSSERLVPGDLVLLSAGDMVPADLRLTETTSLELDEAILTGESLPVQKDAGHSARPEDPLGDQRGMTFSGTLVTRGAGRGVVTATGPRSALGAIAGQLGGERRPTPLQEELVSLTTRLGAVAVAAAAVAMALIVARTGLGTDALERAFLSAVALAVAAIPEGLPTVVTVGLALGVRRMARRGAIIRRLPAVETLGSTTVLLTDKTGTLTENRMELEALVLAGSEPLPPSRLPEAVRERIVRAAVLCNDAGLDPPTGDPVDLALLRGLAAPAAVAGLSETHPRRRHLPFESERRRMTTVHQDGERWLLLVKGAPETVLERCGSILLSDGDEVPLDGGERERIGELVGEMATRGMRLLALASRSLETVPDDPETAEHDLVFLALAVLRDPVRSQASETVREAQEAGIRLVMVTGDHLGTARAVASEVGLLETADGALVGAELRQTGITGEVLATPVFARVDAEQKLHLVEAFQGAGEVVAVTGDGVNDAPALRRADIGVAMGRSGSAVARQAADMVVTDDDLATIVTAIREGRGIYDNIRKVVDYLVAGNLSEVTVVLTGLLFFPALGIPLTPLQLLWINLLTDGLPALALGADPADPGLMDRPPRPPAARLLARHRLRGLVWRGLLMAAAALAALAVTRFLWAQSWETARTAMFTALVVAHLLYAFPARLPTRGLASNRGLLAAVGIGLGLQAAVVIWPPAMRVFGTVALDPSSWLLVLGAGMIPAAIMMGAGRLSRRWR